MAKADVLTLLDLFAGTRSDTAALATSTTVSAYYDDVIAEHGLLREGLMTAEFVAVTAGDATYAFPADAVRVLAWIYDAVELRPTTRRSLEAYDEAWRSRPGDPRAYTTQDEDARTVRVVPVPAVTGDAIGVATPFVDIFPNGNLAAIYTSGAEDHPQWDELWITLDVLGREFSRDSDHVDLEFATAAMQLATVVRILVGYPVPAKDGKA